MELPIENYIAKFFIGFLCLVIVLAVCIGAGVGITSCIEKELENPTPVASVAGEKLLLIVSQADGSTQKMVITLNTNYQSIVEVIIYTNSNRTVTLSPEE